MRTAIVVVSILVARTTGEVLGSSS